MATNGEDGVIIEPDDFSNHLNSTIKKSKELQDNYIKKGQELGYIVEGLEAIEKNYNPILSKSGEYSEMRPIIYSGYLQIERIDISLDSIGGSLVSPYDEIGMVNSMVSTLCSTSGSVAGTISPGEGIVPEIPSFLRYDGNKTYEILLHFEPSLANSYKEIEQVLYGTNADKVRTSMMVCRQFFDHFFNVMVENDEAVISSRFWKRKKGQKDEMQVTRKERMQFAIDKHIKDSKKADNLVNNLENIVSAYTVLNDLHTRGKIDETATKKAVFAIKNFLEEFADAM